jgi:plastocyanin
MFAAAPAQAQHTSISGPLANATVSFGQWKTDPPLDRFLPFAPPQGGHHVTPQEVTIKAAGSVNFIIAGLHLVLVYGAGTQPGSINVGAIIPGTPPLINDPINRIYRGLDPRTQSLDRVEVVHFHTPGTYLVICGVLPHFNDGMFGFIRVLA